MTRKGSFFQTFSCFFGLNFLGIGSNGYLHPYVQKKQNAGQLGQVPAYKFVQRHFMKFSVLVFLGVGLVAGMGCVSSRQFKELEARKLQADRELDSLRTLTTSLSARTADQEVALNQCQTIKSGLEADTNRLAAQIRSLRSGYNDALAQNELLEANYKRLQAGRESETSALMRELREAQERLLAKEDSLKVLETTLQEKAKRLSELEAILSKKDEDVRRLRAAVAEALRGFEGSGLTVEERNGKVYVSLSDKLMFATGSDEVDEKGRQALVKLAEVLDRNPTIAITIEGHTDNIPVRPGGRLKDNWDLSVLRATSIIRILQNASKISPTRFTASGRAEFLPVVGNETPEDRARNRRTEIILTPRLDDLFRILESN